MRKLALLQEVELPGTTDDDTICDTTSLLETNTTVIAVEKGATDAGTHIDLHERAVTQSVLSCVVYSICSVAMVLTNKGISAVVDIEMRKHLPQFSIIIYQCLLAILFTESARCFGLVSYPSFQLNHARLMVPLNILFIGMLISGFLSLVYVSVPMVTVFKNLTNLATVFGDWYFFGEQ